MKRLVIAATSALGLLTCAPAQAGEARCIWERVPEAERAAILAHDADTLADAMRTTISDQEYVAALSGCAVTIATAKDAGSALNAYVLQLKSQQTLGADAMITPDRLDAAWNALDETLRARLAKHAVDDTVEPDASPAAMQAFVDHLGLTGDLPSGEAVALTTYVLSRAARSVFEPKF